MVAPTTKGKEGPCILVRLQVVQDAVADARDVCLRDRGDAPDVHCHGNMALTIP